MSGNDLLDDFLLNFRTELVNGNVLRVLATDDDSVNANRHNSSTVVLVFNGDLSLGVRSQPRERAVFTGSCHGEVESVGELDGEGEVFRGFVGSISEHDTLVTSTKLLQSLLVVQSLSNISGLGLNGVHDIACLVVETLVRAVVTNLLDGIADDFLVVEVGFCGDFAENKDQTGLGGGLAGNFGEGVFFQAGVEDGIGDLVADLVGVALTDGFGGEEESARVLL